MAGSTPTVNEVLQSFALEPDLDKATLERYLRDYPEHAVALIDCSQALFYLEDEEDQPLDAHDHHQISSAWARFQSVAAQAVPALSQMDAAKLGQLSRELGLPRTVILAFSERAVIANSVPRRVLTRLAELLESNVLDLTNYLALPRLSLPRNYKADDKPKAQDSEKAPFERLLRDAGVPKDEIDRLLADEP